MNKFSEISTFRPVTTWVPLTNFQQYTAYAEAGDASPLDDVTIQLRKATDASGTNAANHGSAVTAAPRASASVRAEDLGDFSTSLQYTHVSASVSDEDSPNTLTSAGILTDPRFTVDPQADL